MSTSYRIYRGNTSGGPIDYGTVVATTASLTYTLPALNLGDDVRYAVRAFDTASGLEETNVDAITRVTVHASTGANLADRPNVPKPIGVSARAGGTAKVTWSYASAGQLGVPTGFKVWKSTGAINYAAAADATVAYVSGTVHYTTTLTSLSDATSYNVAVRAYNATTDDGNTDVYTVIGDTTAPAVVDSIAAAAIVAD